MNEQLSAGEAAFERWRTRIGLVAGPLAFFLIPERLPALMALAAIWWVTEAIPAAAVALLIAVLAVLSDIATPKEAFGAFGQPLLFLFVGSFFIAEGMKVHGLGERLAASLARLAKGPRGLLGVLMLAAFLLSLWMSNTAATAITLPIAVSIAGTNRRLGAAVVLACAYGASVGGVGTPVGTPPNLIGLAALRNAGVDIGFGHWMSFGLPLGLCMLAALWLLLSVVFRLGREATAVVLPPRGRWNRGEQSVLVALGLAVTGWLLPTVFSLAAPGAEATVWIQKHLTEEIVALLAGCSLFVLPGGPERPALHWREATRIDWSVLFLFGGGMLLGDLANKTGLAGRWGDALISFTGADSLWTLTAVVTAAAIILSEATSNTATATLLCPLVIAMAAKAGVSPIPPALGATLGASFGFMLPISTAPNAMAYGTGRVTIPQMVRAGILFDVIGFAVIVGGLRLLCPLLGLD